MKKITYTKKDIIEKIKSENNLSMEESKVMLELVLDAIKNYLLKAEKSFRIEFRDFGIFEIKPTKPRNNARNPKTLEVHKIPARRKVVFKPGKSIKTELKKKLNV